MSRLIGSGYFKKEPSDGAFETMWLNQVEKALCIGERVPVIISVGSSSYPLITDRTNKWMPRRLYLHGNAGHINDLVVKKTKDHKFCGWSATVMALAMIAYADECDLIYLEQDCLAFGEWVEHLYAACEDGGKVAFGSCDIQPAAQSLFLVKHDYIPEFVKLYLQAGQDNDPTNLPEMKFARLEKEHPEQWRRFGMGFDRDRPDEGLRDYVKNLDPAIPWYLQQITPEELEILKEANLV